MKVFYKIGLLKNFTKFTGKHLCRNPFLNKVPAWRSATLLKQKLWHMCFLWIFAKFLRTGIFVENLQTAASEKTANELLIQHKKWCYWKPFKLFPKNVIKKHSNKSVQWLYKIAILKNFAKFTSKHLCWNLFFNEFSGLWPAILFKWRLQHRCFLVNLVKFLTMSFQYNTSDPSQNSMDPHYPRQNFIDPCNPRKPTQIFHPRDPHKFSTHTTHAPSQPTSPRNPHNLADLL